MKRVTRLSSMMAIQAFIITEADDSEQTTRRTLKQHRLTPIFFQVKIFFSMTGFQLFRVLYLKTWAPRCMNHGMLLQCSYKTTGKELQKKGSDGCTLVLKLCSSSFHSLKKPVIFTRFTKLTTTLRAPFLSSPHVYVHQNEALMRLTCLNHVVLAVRKNLHLF